MAGSSAVGGLVKSFFIDSLKVKGLGTDLSKASGTIAEYNAKIAEAIADLNNCWKGPSYEAFVETIGEYTPMLSEIPELFAEYAVVVGDIDEAAEAMISNVKAALVGDGPKTRKSFAKTLGNVIANSSERGYSTYNINDSKTAEEILELAEKEYDRLLADSSELDLLLADAEAALARAKNQELIDLNQARVDFLKEQKVMYDYAKNYLAEQLRDNNVIGLIQRITGTKDGAFVESADGIGNWNWNVLGFGDSKSDADAARTEYNSSTKKMLDITVLRNRNVTGYGKAFNVDKAVNNEEYTAN